MKITKTFFTALLAVLALTFALTACGKNPPTLTDDDDKSITPVESTSEVSTDTSVEPATTTEQTMLVPEVDWDKASNPPSSLSPAAESDFDYQYNGDLGGVVITLYKGEATEVLIPETIENEPVIKIDKNAFNRNHTVEYVYFPENLKEIDMDAFCFSKNLTLVIPDRIAITADGFHEEYDKMPLLQVKNLVLKDIFLDMKYPYYLPYFNMLIEDNITENIKYNDKVFNFAGTNRSQSVKDLYAEVTGSNYDEDLEFSKTWEYKRIDEDVNLKSFSVNATVKIDEIVHLKGIALTKVLTDDGKLTLTVPDKIEGQPVVALLGIWTDFYTKAVNLTLPDSIKIISGGFKSSAFKTMNIPNDLLLIGQEAFSGAVLENEEIIFPKNIKIINDYAFQNLKAKSVTLPKNLLYLGYDAFPSSVEIRYFED